MVCRSDDLFYKDAVLQQQAITARDKPFLSPSLLKIGLIDANNPMTVSSTVLH
jgi:hypothetical protein